MTSFFSFSECSISCVFFLQAVRSGMAKQNVATRQLLQECKTSHFPDHDNPEPLRLAAQRQTNSIHGQVSISKMTSMYSRYMSCS